MLTSRRQLLAFAPVVLLSACGGGPPGDAGRLDAKLVGNLAPGDEQVVAQAVNAFGFDLFHEVADGKRNTVTSPLSMATLMAMILAGAEGDAAPSMARMLHLADRRDVRVGALLRALADTDDVTFSVADALWADADVTFNDDYLNFVRRGLGATVEQSDLAAPATAADIDAWVQKNTGKRIDHIAGDLGLPSPDAVLAVLNAVYFLGKWTTTFDRAVTRPSAFAVAGAGSVQVPTMRLAGGTFGYAELGGYRMLRLPYGKGRFGMEIMLPDEGRALPALLASLTASSWRAAVAGLNERMIDEIALPTFELRWSATLNQQLIKLGMPVSGFRGMSPADPTLSAVVHKTYIRVNEDGTEAAAVSGGAMATSAQLAPRWFRVDRPFAFTISDRRTGTILFLGAVTDPRA